MMKFTLVLILFCNTYHVKAAVEGSFCKTPDNQSAKCIRLKQCDSLYALIKSPTRTNEQVAFLRKSQCGLDNTGPLVCCGTDNLGSSDAADALAPYEPNPLLSNRNNCGIQAYDKILGGEQTALDEFPWMAIFEYEKPSGERRLACAGSLINSRYILTAAHCVTGTVLQKVGRLINIRLGEWNTSSPGRDCRYIKNYAICNKQEINLGFEKTIPHPFYNPNDINKMHDIALVRLAREVSFSDFIAPICLPTPNEGSSVGENLIVSGWGKTETGKNSDIKLKLTIPLKEKAPCAQLFQSFNLQLGRGQICAGGQNGKDSCTGDSGGPLMRTFSDDASRWYIEGVVSFGNVCGLEGWPGVYTKVSEYVAWIHRTVKP